MDKANTWNTLLKCTWVAIMDTHNFQEGKIYEVKNGKLIDGNGKLSNDTYDNIYDINECFYANFIEAGYQLNKTYKKL